VVLYLPDNWCLQLLVCFTLQEEPRSVDILSKGGGLMTQDKELRRVKTQSKTFSNYIANYFTNMASNTTAMSLQWLELQLLSLNNALRIGLKDEKR